MHSLESTPLSGNRVWTRSNPQKRPIDAIWSCQMGTRRPYWQWRSHEPQARTAKNRVRNRWSRRDERRRVTVDRPRSAVRESGHDFSGACGVRTNPRQRRYTAISERSADADALLGRWGAERRRVCDVESALTTASPTLQCRTLRQFVCAGGLARQTRRIESTNRRVQHFHQVGGRHWLSQYPQSTLNLEMAARV